ncbi:conserved unknown protein [Ectocarpus siliculosus]|uniref:MI domain-containing protein n=1 Tax=Ectocarpus siliculosus TaxID=2880 RepID=D8LF71_ECTSI|nr:conserved unknown protein [Ectocarpus siliculosus]|eukprot:CBN78669.1 conserved unknown protein [Ectocarpus siliculosus]
MVKGGARGSLSRKELRKAHKQAAKEKKQQRHILKQQTSSAGAVTTGPVAAAAAAAAAAKKRKPQLGGKRKQGGAVAQKDGGGANGARRKRWRPEEIDPMIAAEDAELKRLERLLGVTGPNAKKKRSKLAREIEVEDGMGDEFGAFLSDLDRIGEFVEGGGGSGSSDEDRALMEEEEEEVVVVVEEEEEEEEEEMNSRSPDTTGYGDEGDSPGTPAAEEESEDFKRHTYKPKPGQDIYGRTIGPTKGGAAPAAYVPPHLRAAAAAAEGGTASGGTAADKFGGNVKRAEVQRVVNGIMNRLSEDTLEPVTARLREAYRGHSTTEVNEALWQATRAVCVHDKHVMTTLIPSFTAVIAALNISLGADVGGFFLEIIAKELKAEVWGATGEGRAGTGCAGGSGSARRGGRGTGSNLLLLLAYLYNYGVAHCTLVYDIIGLLVDAFGADEMELLLLLLRHSGYQLRSDDPQALKQIVALVKEKSTAAVAGSGTEAAIPGSDGGEKSSIAEETDRWKEAFASSQPRGDRDNDGDGNTAAAASAAGDANTALGGSRARYILDTILELQGNKRSRIQEQGQESGRRVRKWLGSVKAAKGGGGGGAGGGGDASLRVTWSELVSTENKGRWWRVGAAWAGRGASASSSPAAATVESRNGGGAASLSGSTGSGGANDSEAVGLLALAARQRMNTDVRRSVFVAIVGSSDCEDAFEKILRLNLKGAQEREIARVIVECCSQEGSYNPFYAHLAERVCDRQPKLRFTFQVAFWDALKTLDDGAARRAGSLARLMAHLVVRKQLSLTVLKTVDVQELSPSGLLLMRVFFHEIIAAGDDAAFMEHTNHA